VGNRPARKGRPRLLTPGILDILPWQDDPLIGDRGGQRIEHGHRRATPVPSVLYGLDVGPGTEGYRRPVMAAIVWGERGQGVAGVHQGL